jgi:hypothetical protein
VTVSYLDHDDGTGVPCPNQVNPADHGLVRSTTAVFLGETCEIQVVTAEIADNGDHDEFVDTNETVEMRLWLLNNCERDLHNCAARISTNDPKVDCIIRSVIDVGDLANTAEPMLTQQSFLWKLAAVNRTDVDEPLSAHFNVTISCDEIDALSQPQSVSLPLDLDLDDQGQPPVAWFEGFESGGLGQFEPENLDAGIPGQNNTEGHINGDGWRCQYHDPDWVTAGAYGNEVGEDCFPGATLEQSNAVFWHVDGSDTGSPDGGRAKSGSYSMYYGIYLTDPPGEFTTPLAIVESVRTTQPINLGIGTPTLSYWHQVSLVDGRFLNVDPSRSADRGVVQLKTMDLAGEDTSVWTRLEPFQNTYDTQAYDYYFNCMFDPVDDGSTEDDFFDPTDPNRRLGPSSTCYPMFAYSCVGDTDEPFAPGNICNATTEPGAGDHGSLGTGTWVESKVDLTEYRGLRIKLRFLVTGIKASDETHEGQFDCNPCPWDDGWWIDDVTIDETFTQPVELVVDTNVLRHCAGDDTVGCLSEADCADAGVAGPCEGEAPTCGPTCTVPTTVVSTDPDETGGALDEILIAPGRPIEMNAAASFGRCLDGALQFRYSIDNGPALRGWSEDPVFIDAPVSDTDYLVEVRCSTDASCMDSVVVDVDVDCPSSGTLGEPFPEIIVAETKTLFSWTTPFDFHLFAGELHAVGAYTGDLSSGTGSSFAAGVTPGSPGDGFYFLVRHAGEFCNDVGQWTSGGPSESPARESTLP